MNINARETLQEFLYKHQTDIAAEAKERATRDHIPVAYALQQIEEEYTQEFLDPRRE